MFTLKNKYILLLVLSISVAIALRLPVLSLRPMHGDEAVNAFKFAELLESGQFRYNPQEYHGPSLYYLTLPFAWISGSENLESLNETTLRMLPVISGIILLLLPLLFAGRWSMVSANMMILLAAISPVFVFYSRYYIHEMILVLTTYMALFSTYHYLKENKIFWLLISALSFSIMIATKETWILILSSMVISSVFIYALSARYRKTITSKIREIPGTHRIIFFTSVFIITILLFTSFLQRIEDLYQIPAAYQTYFSRGYENTVHLQPWYMYFKWLLFSAAKDGFWSEGVIMVLALIGYYYIFFKKNPEGSQTIVLIFIALFSLILTFMFSILPYKTPWNLLTFWYGFILVAGYGSGRICDRLEQKKNRLIMAIIIALALGHLAFQSYQLNFKKYASPENPYCYAQPLNDVLRIKESLDEIAHVSDRGYQIHIQVIAAGNDYWPLPWYLRQFKHTGWWDHVDFNGPLAPVIIGNAAIEDQLMHKIYEIPPPGNRRLYLPLFDEYLALRPGIEWRGYITKEIWDRLNASEHPVPIQSDSGIVKRKL